MGVDSAIPTRWPTQNWEKPIDDLISHPLRIADVSVPPDDLV